MVCPNETPFSHDDLLPSRPKIVTLLFIHRQGVDVVQEVANLFGKQRWWALGEVQFDAFQKQRFFSGKGVLSAE